MANSLLHLPRYSLRLPATLLRFSLGAGLAYTAYAMWADVVLSVREVARDSRIILTSIAQAGQFVLHGRA